MFQAFFEKRKLAAEKAERDIKIRELNRERAKLYQLFKSTSSKKLKLKYFCEITDIKNQIDELNNK